MSGLSHDKHPVRTAFTVSLSNYPPCPMAAPVIYTTNAIESVNMALRKVTRNHRIFPSDEAVYKVVYLAIRNIAVARGPCPSVIGSLPSIGLQWNLKGVFCHELMLDLRAGRKEHGLVRKKRRGARLSGS